MDVTFTNGWARNTRQEHIVGEGATGVVAEIGCTQHLFQNEVLYVGVNVDKSKLCLYDFVSYSF